MRVRIVSPLPGANMAHLSPGDEEDFPAEDALRLIGRGLAEAVEAPKAKAKK